MLGKFPSEGNKNMEKIEIRRLWEDTNGRSCCSHDSLICEHEVVVVIRKRCCHRISNTGFVSQAGSGDIAALTQC